MIRGLVSFQLHAMNSRYLHTLIGGTSFQLHAMDSSIVILLLELLEVGLSTPCNGFPEG